MEITADISAKDRTGAVGNVPADHPDSHEEQEDGKTRSQKRSRRPDPVLPLVWSAVLVKAD